MLVNNSMITTNFVVDTGSTKTFISPLDTRKLRFPRISSSEPIELGSIVLNLFEIKNAKLKIRDVNSKFIELEGKIYGSALANVHMQPPPIPSLLGKDFLDKFNLIVGKRDGDGTRHLED